MLWRNHFTSFTPLPASSVKDHEKDLINYGFINPAKDKFSFVEGTVYLWIFTYDEKNREPGEIYLGVESPLTYPQAFHEKMQDYLKKEKQKLDEEIARIKTNALATPVKNQIDQALVDSGFPNRGHATLAVKFAENGKALPAQAYIGGEISYKENKWVLNNLSGRFHHVLEHITIEERKKLLEVIANQLYIYTNTKFDVEVILDKNTLESLWKRKKIDRISYLDVAVLIILKVFKEHIPSQINQETQEVLSCKKTLEYRKIKADLYAQQFSDIKSLIQYVSDQTFIEKIKNSLNKYGNEVIGKIESQLKLHVDFLKTKVDQVLITKNRNATF